MYTCPNCKKPISEATTGIMPLNAGSKQIEGLVITCPLCETILGITIEPYALIEEIRRIVFQR